MEKYMTKYLIYSLLWSMSGDGKLKIRKAMGEFIRSITTIPLPAVTSHPIIDFEVKYLANPRLYHHVKKVTLS